MTRRDAWLGVSGRQRGDQIIDAGRCLPGTSHQWTAIDSPDLAYVIARIDPDKRQAAGLVNSALKQ